MKKYSERYTKNDNNNFKILEKLRKKNANQQILNDIEYKICEHMEKHPCGSLYNYGGAYGQIIVKYLQDNYPELFYRLDMISHAKGMSILDLQFNRIKNNERTKTSPAEIQTIIEQFFPHVEESQQQSFTIITGYPVIQNGNFITPERKK